MANLEKYMDLQADFYHYMVEFGGIAKKTSCDYVTRMKFLAHDYSLDETLTQEKIDEILRQEDLKRQERTVYTSKKSLSDFRAGLQRSHRTYQRFTFSKVGKSAFEISQISQ